VSRILKIIRAENSLSLIGNLVFAFFGFANIFILARTLSKDDFGEWVIYLSGMALLEMIRKGITSTPLVRFLAGASSQDEQKTIVGSAWTLSVLVTIVGIIVLYTGLLLFPDPIKKKSFDLFFIWYPVLSILILPLNTALSVLQARRQFGKILNLRAVNMGTFFIFLVANYFWLHWSLTMIVLAHLASHLLASLYSMIKGWSGISTIFHTTRAALKEQLGFGKYSLVTLIGSNLLKSSDTIIIGIMMTGADVAYYSIPLKLIEIIEIPLRSMVQVAFPAMSKASRENKPDIVRTIFYKYTGLTTILFIPMAVVLFLAAKPLTILLGGAEYASSYVIFQIFVFYSLFLPMDRFSGVTLDAINRPALNTVKVLCMALVNIIGDILVIRFFNSLEGVAICTILNSIAGVIAGNLFLRKDLGTHMIRIFPAGMQYMKETATHFLKK
jgi:O-antigen/teichoic acid export membrane protein